MTNFQSKVFKQTVVGALALLACTMAAACYCIPRNTTVYYARASTVVIGKVTSRTNTADMLKDIKDGKKYVPRVSVRVQETFKGESSDTLILEDHHNSCSLYMRKGDRVILFLDKDKVPDRCDGSAVMFSDEVLRTEFKTNERDIRTYQEMLRTRVAELRNAMPKKWWQIWR